MRRGNKRATVATVHKMLRCIHAMFSNDCVYRDPQTDYEALMVKRNAPRWIAMRKKHGVDPVQWRPTSQPSPETTAPRRRAPSPPQSRP